MKEFLFKVLRDVHTAREKQTGDTLMRQVEKFAYLSAIDHLWIDHIDYIDGLREGVRLRAYGQRDPLVEFKNEAYGTFETLVDRVDEELAHRIYRIGVAQAPRPEIPLEQARTNVDTVDAMGLAQPSEVSRQPSGIAGTESRQQKADSRKVGRNDPCPCGSGKKYKKCHYPQYG